MSQAAHRSPLEKFLGLFTEVRSGESGTALLLTLNVFLLLTTYYIVKPVREALILAGGGAEIKSYASVGQAALLLLAAACGDDDGVALRLLTGVSSLRGGGLRAGRCGPKSQRGGRAQQAG